MILTLILNTSIWVDNNNGPGYVSNEEATYFYNGTKEECNKLLDDIVLSTGKTSVLFATITEEEDCYIDGAFESYNIELNGNKYKLLYVYKE